MNTTLKDDAIKHIDDTRTCPDCKLGGLLLGPRGGSSINVRCDHCGKEFSLGIMLEHVVFAERLDRSEPNLYAKALLPKIEIPLRENVMGINPGPNPFKITRLFAIIAKQTGGEGIMGMDNVPMVTSNVRHLEMFIPIAKQLAAEAGVTACLRVYDLVEDHPL